MKKKYRKCWISVEWQLYLTLVLFVYIFMLLILRCSRTQFYNFGTKCVVLLHFFPIIKQWLGYISFSMTLGENIYIYYDWFIDSLYNKASLCKKMSVRKFSYSVPRQAIVYTIVDSGKSDLICFVLCIESESNLSRPLNHWEKLVGYFWISDYINLVIFANVLIFATFSQSIALWIYKSIKSFTCNIQTYTKTICHKFIKLRNISQRRFLQNKDKVIYSIIVSGNLIWKNLNI